MSTKTKVKVQTHVGFPHWGIEHTLLLVLLVIGGILAVLL
jgi:hypothetical protein